MSNVQAIIFDKSKWTSNKALKWLINNNYYPIKNVHITKNYLRYRLIHPNEDQYKYRLFTLPNTNKTIKMVLEYPK